ncbi:MAG: BREX system P-loop protein BrxC, partial [Desulfobacterales bacterium]|nr:BREX system P-loop protein BrxC [Desulfobacterales bacterium]
MKNREIFQRDPAITKLLNDGVAAVTESATKKEIETLRYELEHFVCEGQYKGGLTRILESYLGNADSTVQPAAWVSGFFGSGKSHLLKMFRHLWVDSQFESDGATTRGLTQLPDEVSDLLKELDTLGKRCGGLHAASGTLPSGGGESVRLAVLSIILRSKGLPSSLPQAQFCIWLQKNNIYEKVKAFVESAGKDFQSELHDLYVSPVLAQALLDADPAFAPDLKQARAALRTQFPVVKDVSTEEFIRIIRKVLSTNGEIPCTVIVLDEIQLFIGDSAKRSTDVMEIAEAICKQLNSRVLLIGAGQTALAGSVPLMQRLRPRFTIPVELSDSDVETVTRRVVLAKKADKRKAIENTINAHAGEIDRQLSGTRIGVRSEDRAIIVDDYPLLPVRRRFWEHTLRAIDIPGTSSQVRTQLRIVYDAVKEMAEKPLGTVMPADFIFDQLQPDLLRTGVLLREIDETVRNLDDATPEGKLAKRICGLVFLIRKLPHEEVADIGVRATAEMMADLLISDLASDGATLRKEIPQILDKLVDEGKLIKIDEEYSLQTRESSEWDREFRNRQTRLNNDLTALAGKRSSLLNAACSTALNGIKLLQGKCKAARRLSIHFGTEPPEVKGNEIPVWIRDG